ncbi:hypothetical protein K438DRAFT_1754753 [Mycena galopus ATCC 62051]|nr:hypothetical protein K438DRAFT_1754753 [Mycena galopus ATCC 62051]
MALYRQRQRIVPRWADRACRKGNVEGGRVWKGTMGWEEGENENEERRERAREINGGVIIEGEYAWGSEEADEGSVGRGVLERARGNQNKYAVTSVDGYRFLECIDRGGNEKGAKTSEIKRREIKDDAEEKGKKPRKNKAETERATHDTTLLGGARARG